MSSGLLNPKARRTKEFLLSSFSLGCPSTSFKPFLKSSMIFCRAVFRLSDISCSSSDVSLVIDNRASFRGDSLPSMLRLAISELRTSFILVSSLM